MNTCEGSCKFPVAFNVGIYTRLSREDEASDVSESIKNQKDFLISYVIENGWNLVEIYCDDGYSGTNFNRPDFQRMLQDIEKKRINLVATKDLSRLGRDYIDTGYYIERFFPLKNVRYIAVTDGIDTFLNSSNNDMSPFKSVINDFYARDISKKVRTAMSTKRNKGEFIGAFAPYGYAKDPTNKNKLIVDEATAPIVKRIYGMYLEGNSLRHIAQILNGEGILSPSAYKGLKSNYKNGNTKSWYPETIKIVLSNPTYCGNLAQNKCTILSYKVKKQKNIPRESWKIVDDTHEAIIDKETFEHVQLMLKNKAGTYYEKKKSHLLGGLLYCGDCGAKITFLYSSNPNKTSYTACSKYKRFGATQCTRHTFSESKLEECVLGDLKRIATQFIDRAGMLKKACVISEASKQTDEFGLRRAPLEKRLIEIKKIIKSLYEDKYKGLISEGDFMEISLGYNREREQIQHALSELDKQETLSKSRGDNHEKTLEAMKDLLEFKDVSQAVLAKLVDKIEIFEKSADQRIIIQYSFKDPSY